MLSASEQPQPQGQVRERSHHAAPHSRLKHQQVTQALHRTPQAWASTECASTELNRVPNPNKMLGESLAQERSPAAGDGSQARLGEGDGKQPGVT